MAESRRLVTVTAPREYSDGEVFAAYERGVKDGFANGRAVGAAELWSAVAKQLRAQGVTVTLADKPATEAS